MRLITLLLFSLLLLAWWARAYAQADAVPQPGPVILTDEQDKYPLGLHLEILEDRQRRFDNRGCELSRIRGTVFTQPG